MVASIGVNRVAMERMVEEIKSQAPEDLVATGMG
jgi:hypothetical protein